MRLFVCVVSLLIATATTGAVAYYVGHDRALGHEEWRFERRLVSAYASEIPIHAGPIVLLAIASCVGAIGSRRAAFIAFASTVIASVLTILITRESVRAYIVAPPGAMMWMPSTCVIALGLLWLASLCILAAVAIAVVVTKSRNRKAVAAGTSREGHQS